MDRTVSFGKIKFRSLLFASGFAQILQVLSLMSGTLIVGNIVGEIGLSGINVVTPAYSGAFFVAGLIGTGTVYLYARELGCFQTEHASQLFS